MRQKFLCMIPIMFVFMFIGCDTVSSSLDSTELTYYTVTFNTDGGTAIDSQRIASDSKATKPTNPTKENYAFIDWFTSSDFSRKFDFNSPVTEDITLYAKWDKAFTVRFDTDGGTTINPQQVANGNKVTEPTVPTKDHYMFIGWFTSADFSKKFDFNSPITEDITLYAKFSYGNL